MIWIIAIILLALFAGIGFLIGAIRMGVSLVGALIALFLAVPLAGLMEFIYVKSGMTNLVWLNTLPPATMFVVLGLIFFGVSFYVHHKIALHYKFKTDEVTRLSWERLNQRTGVALGVVTGFMLTMILGTILYFVGYFTVQVASDNDPSWLKYINQTRTSMKGSGFEKVVSSFDPMNETYYQVSDLLGLAHSNPLLETRFRNYPPFLKLRDRSEIQQMANDGEYHSMLVQQASIADIIKHPVTTSILSNGQLLNELVYETDLKDLREYLETGTSPTYKDEAILGRWKLNGNALINNAKRKTVGIKAKDIRALTQVVEEKLSGTTMIAFPEKNLAIDVPERAPEEEEEEQQQNQPDDPYAEFNRGGTANMSPEMRARYGMAPAGQGGRPAQGVQAQAPAQPAGPAIGITEPGTWASGMGGNYIFDVTTNGKKEKVRAEVVKGKLYIKTKPYTLVFSKTY